MKKAQTNLNIPTVLNVTDLISVKLLSLMLKIQIMAGAMIDRIKINHAFINCKTA